ncbi:MAG: acetyltransferase [Phycisphaerae bacterium]|jgi:acetyltransferase|nr:MAG: acetyltransferase [Phycisphaerae bacterium]
MTEPAHDLFRRQRSSFEALFSPRTVAVIGASETRGSVGRTVLWNLLSNPFGGTIFPIHPNRGSVLGIQSYADLLQVPVPIDLAVICTDPTTVPGLIGDCVRKGVKSVIILSGGFDEPGNEGQTLGQQILQQVRGTGIRILGPDSLGVMNPLTGLNASSAGGMARPGKVAFISQSGALCTAVLDWSLREQVGFSAFVSVGSMLDVGWGDLIDYLGSDPRTQSILIYMETIGDARRFLSSAREVALGKPIIVIKPGRFESVWRSSTSDPGLGVGSEEVLEAAFRRVGVLRVNNISDLFHMAEVLSKQPRPKGNRLTIVTNAKGPGMLAIDALTTQGGALARLSEKTLRQLNTVLPRGWSHTNPIDIGKDADPDRYTKTLQIVTEDEQTDGLLVILTPLDVADPTVTAERLKAFASETGKPVLASWMGGTRVATGESILNASGIPTFAYPDTAARMFAYMSQYSSNLNLLYETPTIGDEFEPDTPTAERVIRQAMQERRTILDEYESKRVLAAYGIQTVPTLKAHTPEQAIEQADQVGYPCVLKLCSRVIRRKPEGGVRLNLQTPESVRQAFEQIRSSAMHDCEQNVGVFEGVTVQPMVQLRDGYELMLGSFTDRQFGPVILFGAGGQLMEICQDRTGALPPLNATLAKRVMERTRIYRALSGVGGRPAINPDHLASVMIRFSELLMRQPRLAGVEINPLVVWPRGILVLDARVTLHPSDVSEDQLPRPAIRPYPIQYVCPFRMRNGTTVLIRPIRPEDEPMMIRFHEQLSERTVRLRYFHVMGLSQRTAHERLTRVCFNDYDRDLALVVEDRSTDKRPQILGVARLSRVPGTDLAEFAIVISDAVQNQGLGTELLGRLIKIAGQEGVHQIFAEILYENHQMQKLCKKMGFTLVRDETGGTVCARLMLTDKDNKKNEASC